MRRAELDAKAGAAQAARTAVDSLPLEQSIGHDRSLVVDLRGWPVYPPRLRAVDRGHHPLGLDELTAAELAAAAALKAGLEQWWHGGGDWPIAGGVYRS